MFLPWYNWNLIHFLQGLDLNQKLIFEYGVGNSTLFYALRGADVRGVETRDKWLDFVLENATKNQIKNRIDLVKCQDPVNFSDYISQFNTKFDIIVIDAQDRVKCLEKACNFIKSNGMIILDNSERPNLQTAKTQMQERGFKMLTFHGSGPQREGTSEACVFSYFYKKP